ncbi:hypothetical protein PD280_21450 [Virgibacillus salarius]|uniref:hypothetical protein n=1 Tax=Virgibacillus salarius TaxID=447199 RepID=UPI002490F052|nr:hypothetical protein [Virgibacillus salarius]WBX80133.1 hypothetical protein PD280_21450 [Virgibacillus salarius]
MRELLVLGVIVIVMLAGCSSETKIHENINEELAKDSLQVMSIIEKAVEQDQTSDELDDSDYKKLVSYKDKYLNPEDSFMVICEADDDIITFTLGTISQYSNSGLLESDKKDFLENKENVEKIIEQGKIHAELED